MDFVGKNGIYNKSSSSQVLLEIRLALLCRGYERIFTTITYTSTVVS
jgi:hypothetical protein